MKQAAISHKLKPELVEPPPDSDLQQDRATSRNSTITMASPHVSQNCRRHAIIICQKLHRRPSSRPCMQVNRSISPHWPRPPLIVSALFAATSEGSSGGLQEEGGGRGGVAGPAVVLRADGGVDDAARWSKPSERERGDRFIVHRERTWYSAGLYVDPVPSAALPPTPPCFLRTEEWPD
ncbi:uncharacterized protein [Triticum aestivum]|uniref:uncharacterized protein n=1 Tax=Triticum aestivum TaxID=4565 RepID=UPI001D010B56|nr:uncharacterized protein LOC123083210 [Triticum aestivum]